MATRKNSRNASGSGTIRQRKDGSWEARYTLGRDPGTGKQIQKSIYGKTQQDVSKRLRQITTSIDDRAYTEPSKMTISAWLDIWAAEYLGGVKQTTQSSYESLIRVHIKPAVGAVKLQKLQSHEIQKIYNDLQKEGTSAKTIKNIHGVIHKALQQAVELGYIRVNPSEVCVLPRLVKKEMQVLSDKSVIDFFNAIKGHRFETIFYIALLTGMRQSEILGLTWNNLDLKKGTIVVSKQLSKERKKGGGYFLDTPKHDKERYITPASAVIKKLRMRKKQQNEEQLRAGSAWSNPLNLVFTNELGGHIANETLRKHYKRIVKSIGLPDLRFHDLRHSYAVISLMNGDDIKTVQENLGHHTAAFTLDTYAHSTERMKKESAHRMDSFINGIKTLK